jgi:hypothetical protein
MCNSSLKIISIHKAFLMPDWWKIVLLIPDSATKQQCFHLTDRNHSDIKIHALQATKKNISATILLDDKTELGFERSG